MRINYGKCNTYEGHGADRRNQMQSISEKQVPTDDSKETGTGNIDREPTAKTDTHQIEPKINAQYRTKHTDNRRNAALSYMQGITSSTILAKKYGVSRNTIMTWKRKDNWAALAARVDHEILAKAPGRLAQKKLAMMQEIEEDLVLLHKAKKDAKPASLEGIIKASIKLREQLLFLNGEATKRTEAVVVYWKGGTMEPVKQTPLIDGEVIPENTRDIEGGIGAQEGQKDSSIENPRGYVDNTTPGGVEKAPSSVDAQPNANEPAVPGVQPYVQHWYKKLPAPGQEAIGKKPAEVHKLTRADQENLEAQGESKPQTESERAEDAGIKVVHHGVPHRQLPRHQRTAGGETTREPARDKRSKARDAGQWGK